MKVNQVLMMSVLTMFVKVEGLYTLQVHIHNYSNPTGKCPVCIEVLSTEPGCCDRYNEFVCVSNQRCDSYFSYFVRRFGSTEGGENCTQTGDASSSQKMSLPNIDDASIDFSDATILGLENPLVFSGLDNEFKGIQLLVEICDKDDIGADDLIDILPINIAAANVMVGVETNLTTYFGLLNYTTIDLSFTIQCVENFQGSYCSECVPGFTGPQCDVNIDDCIGINCSARGDCVDGVNSFKCDCYPGYTGYTCDKVMEEVTTTGSVRLTARTAVIGGATTGSVQLTARTAVIGGAVGGVAVLGVLVLTIISIAIVILIVKRRNKAIGHIKTDDSDIKMTQNVLYEVGGTSNGEVKLTQNASYVDSRSEVKTSTNIPNQQYVKENGYEYTQYDNYDYII